MWAASLGLCLMLAGAEPAGHRLFVSLAGDERIAVYDVPASGQPRRVAEVALPGEPGALALHPQATHLVASLRPQGKLAALRLGREVGALSLVETIDAGPDPAHLSFDPTGRFLLSAYYVAAKATVHELRNDRLAHPPRQSLPTADKAHAILIDPTGRFAYVPHTGGNVIHQFRWDAGAGKLSPLDPPTLATPRGSGPRHIVFHPRLPLAYINNEQGGNVTAYAIDEATGRLRAEQTVPTLPAEFQDANATAELRLHPSARWLYCANRGHDSLAMIALDPATGRMTFRGTTATEKTPRSFDLSPDGAWLHCAGEGSDHLATYRVDAATGQLTPTHRLAVGARPWWVLAVPLP